MAPRKPILTEEIRSKILLLGVQAPYNNIKEIDTYFDEFISLVTTLGLKYDQTLFIKLRSIDKANFLTSGKLSELAQFCEENQIEEIICSESLTPLQERNLEDLLNCIVWDREKLIIEIFKKSAHTAEGKVQVEMAQLEFLKTRLSGKGVQLAQQEGIVGSRGPGETSKEEVKRQLAEKFRQAKKRLDVLQRSRDVQRKQRLESKIPLVSLVGYTNAGKSSIINSLTKSNVLVENKLFATLDITTRELFLESGKKILLSDTVGFISHLPHHLIEAFKSTLDELKYADLLLHVVDISNIMWQDQLKIVHKTLEDIGVIKNIVYIFNKIDKLTAEELLKIKPELDNFNPHVITNAKTKAGTEALLNFLKTYKFNI